MRKITLLLALFTILLSWQANAQITTYPYAEDFESGDGGWIADNTTAGTWALGTPAATVINSAASGTNAWVTNLTGSYNANESSTVQSPIFDLSSLTAPSIEFSIWWSSENSWDGMVLQSSIDSGASWQNVGALGDPNNWFNDGTINGNPGGQQEGWTGSGGTGSGGWLVARHALVGLNGQSNVIFRFAFGSDGSVQQEGIAFDSISIFEVSCPEVLALTAVTTGDSTADISWGQGGSETDWEIVIQAAGTGVPTSGTATTTNAPYLATTLTPSTAYEVYVRADCGSEFSSWVGPVAFTTFNVPPPPPVGVTCASGSPSTIFTETFGNDANTDPAGWTGTGFDGSNGNWDITPANANSGGSGPANAYDGGAGMHLEYESSGNSTDIASAISPAIDLTTATDGAELAFLMHAFGADFGTLNVNIGNSATGPFTNLFTWVGDYQMADTEAWVPIGINLDAYLGQTIYLEFSYGGAGTGFTGDMSIDQITVETCGSFCIAPSNITVANITGTTADISWTGNNGEAEWQYVIQPAGTGTPTGPGTVVNSPSVNAMNLTFSTDYEIYVLANCNPALSIWAGPINFSTTIQTNFVLDCVNGGPENFNYCYENNDTNVFTFSSTDGTPLNFTINSGQVEAGWDELVIYDTDGVTDLNVATPYGNGGDVSGITYQSTGDTISFTITSDGSVNCQGNGFTPLDITVSCATCINPVATYVVVDDCANGDQFLVDVDITSLGDATSVLIQDNQGNPGISVSATGVTQFGPYPFLTDIIFTVSNEQDGNCVITSSAIQLAACPPANDNPCDATVAVVNDNFICEQSTPGTLIEATGSGVPSGTCTGNPDDDVWFEFTALSEFQLIALANLTGSNTFNIDHALYEGTCDALVEIACTSNELVSITPQLVVGNTYFIRIFSGGNNPETTTFDLCITPYQTPTNITCETTENLCPAGAEGGALYTPNVVGMPNNTSVACLGTIPNPTYSVLEIGSSGDILVEIVQNTAFDATGNAIGSALDVDYVLWGPFGPDEDYCNLNLEVDCPSCPNNTTDPNFYPFGNIADCSYSGAAIENFTLMNAVQGEIYLILVTNFNGDPGVIQISQTNLDPNNPDPDSGTLTSDINVDVVSAGAQFIDDDNDETTPSVANLCGGPASLVLEADSPFADVFEWYQNGIILPGETGPTLTITDSDTYTVFAYDTQCDGSDQQTVIVNFFQEAIVNIVPPEEVNIVTCDDESGDGIEEFDLEALSSIILDSPGQDPADFVVTYHILLNDAQNGINALASPYSAADGTTIYVRVEDVDAVGSGSGCASTNTLFNLVVLGALPTPASSDMVLCDDDSRDGREEFDLDSNSVNILNGQDPLVFDVTYYVSQADADAGTNALTSPYENTSSPQTIFARVENTAASDCYKTIPFDLTVLELPETTFDVNYEVCPNATVPITIEAIAGNYNVSDVTIEWLYEGATISGQTSLELSTVLLAGTYTVIVTNNDALGCSYATDVYVSELASCIIPQGISPNNDGMNDKFDLSSFDVQSLEIFNRNGTLVYSKTGYTDEWIGQSDKGDELPVGTYYYIMKYEGTKVRAAWVYLNR